jgi:hypothetical protein
MLPQKCLSLIFGFSLGSVARMMLDVDGRKAGRRSSARAEAIYLGVLTSGYVLLFFFLSNKNHENVDIHT